MTALPGKPASNSAQSGHDQLLAISPGERLQRARKDRNLEVNEVAERLNLSPGVVRALEADDYRILPNATFVKGYLRSYARAVDISGDDLVRAYEAITRCNEPVKVEPIAAPMISDTRRNQRNVLMGLVVLVLLVAGGWLTLSGDDPVSEAASEVAAGNASETAMASSEEGGDAESVTVSPPLVITRQSESDADVVAAAQATNEPVESLELETGIAESAPTAAAEPVQAPAVVPEPVPVPVATIEPVAVPASSLAPAENAPADVSATPAAESEAATPPPATDGTGLVNLRFQGECWVEVRDRSGKMVFSSLKRAGEEVTLRAATPIHVKLGNGDVVSVQYNHQPVNFTTRPDRKVIRLTLGE